MNTDEVALRQALQDLTVGQPPAPPWRYDAVRRRMVRHRRVQAVTRGTALAAIGAVAVAFAVLPARKGGGAESGSRPVPGWALPWSDHRDGSVPQRVLDGAVNAWRNLHGLNSQTSPLDVRKVIWYVGQTVAGGRDVVVMFEASTLEGKYLVVGYASAAEVMHGQAGWSQAKDSTPWLLYDARPPHRDRGLLIGLNLAVPSNKTNSPDNWIIVLTAPDVRQVTWAAPGPSEQTSYSSSATVSEGISYTDHGLVIANAGQVSDRVQVTSLVVGHRNVLPSYTNVGVPGSVGLDSQQPSDVPALASPAAVAPPSGFATAMGTSGQGGMAAQLRNMIIDRRPVVLVRCYGPQPVRVYLSSRLLGVVRCDNAQHELIARARTRSALDVSLQTSSMTAWQIDIGSVRGS